MNSDFLQQCIKRNLEIKQKKEIIAIKENNFRIILNRR